MLALAMAVVAIALLFSWSTSRTDRISFERQRESVRAALKSQADDPARHQEASLVWDEAFTKTHERVLDYKFIDGLVGTWYYIQLGYDESYLLNDKGKPYYAMLKGARTNPEKFEAIRGFVQPLITELRRKMRNPKANLADQTYLSPGVVDIGTVNGKPAIVSLKPIMPETKAIVQKPGTEHMNVIVAPIDHRFLEKISKKYLLDGVRFSVVDNHGRDEASDLVRSPRTGLAVGYLIWRPFVPGTAVLKDMVAPFLSGLLLFALVIWFLFRRIRQSTTELIASEAQAKHLAFHDILTGLPNRALFEDRLDRALATTRRYPDQKVALLYLDIDRFKQVNDTLGHPAGDELIRELARRLSNIVRDHDTVARLGGDEFAIIQMDVKSPQDTELLCGRILAAVRAPFDVLSNQAFVGMSIGIARSGDDGLDRVELARKADIALYRAKAGGRGRHVVFASAMDETVQARQAVEQDLRAALESGDQLELYYQPQYDAGSGAIAGVEALVRWHHPRHGIVCPSVFIPIAEETGLIEPLGDWILEEACTAALPLAIGCLSVNISAVQLRNPFFAQKVISILQKTGMDPKRLELEITETSFLENIEQCQANLKLLRFLGIRIALDDFGTGYSSFKNLSNYQVDRLKIDQSFTNAIDGSPEGSAIIRAIIALARSSGLKVSAEGVETIEQSAFLSSAGCDELQGFLMSRPIPLDRIDEILGIEPAVRVGSSASDPSGEDVIGAFSSPAPQPVVAVQTDPRR